MMPRRKLPRSAFYRLFFSFTSLTAVIILLIGIVSSILFTSNYTREIEINSKHVLEYEKNAIEVSVFDRIKSIYLDLSLVQTNKDILSFLSGNPLEGNLIALTRTMDSLRECVNLNSNIVDSICIYYQNNNVVVSSNFGVKYLHQPANEAYQRMGWISSAKYTADNGLQWILVDEDTELTGVPNHTIALTGRYPWVYGNNDNDTFVVIFVKANALNNVLSRMSNTSRQAFIIDTGGRILNHADKEKVWNTLDGPPWRTQLLGSASKYKSFTGTINDSKYFISAFTFSNTPWQLVQMIPVDNFYHQSQKIGQTLFVLSLIVFVIGMVLTYIFSFKIYTPLHALVSKVGQFTGDINADAERQNEYTIINGVITNLTVKLNEFEKMLRANEPMIKHSLITSLFHAEIEDEQELKEHLKLTGINLIHSHFTVILLEFDELSIRSLPIKHQQYMKYQLMKDMESGSDKDHLLICTVLDNTCIGMILNSRCRDDDFIQQLALQVYAPVHERYGIRIMAAAGNWVPNPLEISCAFEQSKSLLKYRYFSLKDTCLLSRSLLERDGSKEKIPPSIEERFSQALNLRRLPDASECIRQFVKLATEGFYSSEQCVSRLLKLFQILADFAHNQQYPNMDALEVVLSEPLKHMWNICQLEPFILDIMQKIYCYADSRSNTHNVDTVDSLKEYICQNLDRVLSLDILADIMHFHPKYLSRLFKDTTGENLTDYINQKRMEKAIELLQETRMSVEEISVAVGFNSSHYFIRRFKEIYGYTPKSYQPILKKQKQAQKRIV